MITILDSSSKSIESTSHFLSGYRQLIICFFGSSSSDEYNEYSEASENLEELEKETEKAIAEKEKEIEEIEKRMRDWK